MGAGFDNKLLQKWAPRLPKSGISGTVVSHGEGATRETYPAPVHSSVIPTKAVRFRGVALTRAFCHRGHNIRR